MGFWDILFGGDEKPTAPQPQGKANGGDKPAPSQDATTAVKPAAKLAEATAGAGAEAEGAKAEGVKEEAREEATEVAAGPAAEPTPRGVSDREAFRLAMTELVERLASVDERARKTEGQVQWLTQNLGKIVDKSSLDLRAHLTRELEALAANTRVEAERASVRKVWAGFVSSLDKLDHALREPGAEETPAGRRLGIVQRDLLGALKRLGIETIEVVEGVTRFDERLHSAEEAIARDELPEDMKTLEPEIIVRLERRGFRQGDEVIRPSSVHVVKA